MDVPHDLLRKEFTFSGVFEGPMTRENEVGTGRNVLLHLWSGGWTRL